MLAGWGLGRSNYNLHDEDGSNRVAPILSSRTRLIRTVRPSNQRYDFLVREQCVVVSTATNNEDHMKTAIYLLGIVGFLLGFIFSPSANLKTNALPFKADDDFSITKVTDGVYAAIAKSGGVASGNAGFIVGDGGVLIVDTFLTPTAIEELLDTIGNETKQPIKYAINTHYHLDHTGGNQVLSARGVPIIGHDKLIAWQTAKNRRFLPAPEELQKRQDEKRKDRSNMLLVEIQSTANRKKGRVLLDQGVIRGKEFWKKEKSRITQS